MGTRYVSDIQVIYEVDGQSHICSRVAFGPFSSKEECNKRLVANYPVGRELSVYFDPKAPASSVCSPGVNAAFLWCMVPVGLGVYCGVMMVLQSRSGE